MNANRPGARVARMGALCALLFAPNVLAAPTPAAPAKGDPKGTATTATSPIQLTQWDLANGLHVLFVPVHTSPVVALEVWYHAGSKDEPPHRNGIAHMFEHMMFKGSDHLRPEAHAQMIAAVGGIYNAFTTEDTTTFYETLPKAYLGFALELEAERMHHLKLIQSTVSSERQVVEEELRQNWLDNPIGRLLGEFQKLAYTVHPYHEAAIGEKADLDQVTPKDCQSFYDAYYQPNNATLVLVGDVTEDEARKAVNDAFGAIPRAADPPHPSESAAETEPPQTQYREAVEHWPSQIGLILGGYHLPAASAPDTYPLEVLSTILSDGEESLMNQRLVRKDKIAVAAGGEEQAKEDPGLMILFGAFLDPTKADAVKSALLDVIDEVKTKGVSAEALARAKNQLAAQHTFGLEDVTGIATELGNYVYVRHDPAGFLEAPARYQAVTQADIQRVARKYLNKENLTLVVLPPGGQAGGPGAGPSSSAAGGETHSANDTKGGAR